MANNKSIKALEIKTFMLFDLDFANDTILSCFFLIFLIIDLYFLILAAIAQIWSPVAGLVTPIRMPNKESKSRS